MPLDVDAGVQLLAVRIAGGYKTRAVAPVLLLESKEGLAYLATLQSKRIIDGGDFETVRIKDDDLYPALYDPDSGEYFQRPPPPARNQRQAADAWVAAALMTV